MLAILSQLAKYNYGSKDKNPLEKVWFYSKEDPKKVFKMPPEQVSSSTPVSNQSGGGAVGLPCSSFCMVHIYVTLWGDELILWLVKMLLLNFAGMED